MRHPTIPDNARAERASDLAPMWRPRDNRVAQFPAPFFANQPSQAADWSADPVPDRALHCKPDHRQE